MSETEPVPPSHQKEPDEIARISAAKRLAHAYEVVFGQEGRNLRSAEQSLVLKDLKERLSVEGPVFRKEDGYNVQAAAQRDGARGEYYRIFQQLALAKKYSETQEKPKPKTKR